MAVSPQGTRESEGAIARFPAIGGGLLSRPASLRYGVAVAAVALGWAARYALTPALGPQALPFIFFFPSVAVAAWYGGFRAATLAIVLAALAANWSFISPVHTFALAVHDVAALAAFVVSCLLIAGAIESMHRSQARLGEEVAARGRVVAELALARDLFATTLASIGDGVVTTDIKGCVTFLNGEAERLTGWRNADASGRPLADVFRIIDERTGEPVENPVEKALRLGTVVGLANHTRLIAKDGTVTPIDDSAAPIREPGGEISGVVLVFRDFSEHKQAAASLLESQRRLEVALNAGRMGTWEWHVASGRVAWSPTLEEIHGLQPGTFGGSFDDFRRDMHPDDVGFLAAEIQRSLATGAHYHVTYRITRPDGIVRWVEAFGRLQSDESGAPEKMAGVCMDVTERQEAELALRDADRRKNEFLAMLSHELRNPLAPLRNAIEILHDARGNAELIEAARGIMERQVTSLTRLVDDLLEISRISKGKLQLRKERVDLVEAVHRAAEMARPAIAESAHELTIEVPREPLYLEADPVRIAQVFSNLLNNAAKFTERGGAIWLTATRDGGDAVVSVRDNGIGITAENLPHIFEMFTQVEPAMSWSQGGLGIGLSLTRGLVELHGGTVAARSDGAGAGSEFVVRIPVGEQGVSRGTSAGA